MLLLPLLLRRRVSSSCLLSAGWSAASCVSQRTSACGTLPAGGPPSTFFFRAVLAPPHTRPRPRRDVTNRERVALSAIFNAPCLVVQRRGVDGDPFVTGRLGESPVDERSQLNKRLAWNVHFKCVLIDTQMTMLVTFVSSGSAIIGAFLSSFN